MANDLPSSIAEAAPIGPAGQVTPSAIQGDTNKGVAFVPSNNNWERLSQSLDMFSHGVNHLDRVEGMMAARSANDKLVQDRQAEAQAKQAEMNKQQLALSSYQSSTTAQQQRDDYINGRVPAFANGTYTHDLYMHSAANMAADELSETMTKREQGGQIPYGTDGFNAQQDLLTQAADIKKKYGVDSDPVMSKQFAARLNPMRSAVDERQTKALGEAVQNKNATVNYSEAAEAFDSSHLNQETPQQTSDRMRAVFQAHDPAFGGTGPYSLTGTHNDKIEMQILEDKASDPETAKRALAIMQAPRTDADGNAVPSLAASPSNKAQYDRIASKVAHTLDTAEQGQIADATHKADIAAALQGDKSLAARVQQAPPQTSYGSDVPKMSSDLRTKAAVSGAIDQIRAQNGGQPDLPKELRLCAQNDVPHPQVMSALEQSASVVGSATASPQDQQKSLEQAAQLYHYAQAQNPGWAEKYMNKSTKDMIDKFDLLTKDGGRTNEAATAELGAYKLKDKHDPVTFSHQQTDTIQQAAAGITTVNGGEIGKKITDLATAYSQIEGMDQDKAIEKARDAIKQRYPTLNGVAVSSAEVSPEDYPHVKTIIANTLAANKADFKGDGITDASQMSIHPIAPGRFVIVRNDGGVTSNPHVITSEQIAAQRAQTERQNAAKAVTDAHNAFKASHAPAANSTGDTSVYSSGL